MGRVKITPRYISRFVVKARRIRMDTPIDPQRYREQTMVQLTELANEAHDRALSRNRPTDERQKWSKIAAYIHQTVNTILKAYDTHAINHKLEELTRRVEELMEEAEETGE